MNCPACSTENVAGARFCNACGAALPDSAAPALCSRCRAPNPPGAKFCNHCGGRLSTGVFEDEGKERRVVTVLFADVSGFTSLAEKLDPEEVEERIRACWARLTPVIERHGGYVDKYIGDAVMVLFGAPTAHEDDPERAVRCAMALHQALRGDRLRLRIGVHTGEVIVGSVSDRGEKDYTAMGDTVNTASRLHTGTTPGRTAISVATFRMLGGKFAVRELEPMKVKGKSEAVASWEVLGPAPRVGRAAAREGTPFVGRGAELARLDEALGRVRLGRELAALAVAGAPGVGKGRLVAEWRRRVERAEPGAVFLEGAAAPYGGEPCRAVREAVLARYGTEGDPSERLRAIADDLAGVEKDAGLAAGFIGRLFGIDSGTRGRHLAPKDMRAAAFSALESLLVALSAGGPVVLALGELQWADSATLDFVEHLLRSAPAAPILLLAAGRAEAFRDHAVLADLERLEVPPLGPADTAALASALLGGRRVPAELEDLLHRRTEGNAFFIEETLRSLVEEGALVDDEELEIEGAEIEVRPARAVRLARPLEEMRLPHTVQGVITSRIDALSEDGRKVLKAAAVAGRTFSRALLDRVLGRPVGDALAEIERREMIHHRPGGAAGDQEYAFAHPLIPEVAYREILRRNRKALHKGIAEALEERLAGRRTPELLVAAATHFEKADVRDRAVKLFLEAADRARQVFANQEAITCYTRVLGMAERTDALAGRADVYRHLGRQAEALEDFRKLRELRGHEGDGVRRREAENGLAHTLATMERYAEAEEEARRVAEEARAEGDAGAEALALNTLGYIHVRCRREADARAAWERSEEVARRMGDRRAAAAAINNLGLLLLRGSDLEGALRRFEESISLEREVGNRAGVVASLTNIAEVQSRLGRDAEAVRTYEEAIRTSREIGLKYGLGICLNNLANIQAKEARLAEALETYGQSLALRREMGDRIGVATTLRNTAIVRHLLGDFGGAAGSLERALDLARSIGQPRTVAAVLDARGNLARLIGDFEAAERDHREAHAAEPARAAEWTASIALDLLEAGKREDALALAASLPESAALGIRAAAGEPAAVAALLATPPPLDQSGLAWSAAAVAARRADAAGALRQFAAGLEKHGMSGIAWRARADLSRLTGSVEDADLARRSATSLASTLPPGPRRELFLAHPALAGLPGNPA
ncbi:MAG: tetratricopeptide repeat protein [Planctomycetes bacterium]|nr:tetratricopeptide repeat protein [Planctomycetota bacterium]